MGRPKLEKPTTSKERMQKYRKDEAKRTVENRRRAEARKKKNENVTVTEEELEEKRKNARERKSLSRANIDANSSRQKRTGQKIKDKNRKMKIRNQENLSLPSHCSTPRVRSHREKLIVKIGTLCGGVSKTRRRKVAAAKKSVTAALKVLSPAARSSVLDVSLTPNTKKTVAESYSDTTGSGMGLFKTLAPHRDKLSNCTRQLILGSLSLNKSASRSNWTSLQRAKSTSNILVHYKTNKTRNVKPPSETMKLVQAFYNKDNVSRMLPYKKLTRRVKDHTGVYQRVSVRVMEVTLQKALFMFKALHPEVKICRRTFEYLRPKNIRLTRNAQRLQCGCTYHTNMEYVRKACNNLLVINGKDAVLSTNDALMAAAICDAKSLKCIMGKCEDCKAFTKIDELKLESLKCCKDCIQKANDCKSHTVKVRQFERVTYMHQGKEKKKMALVDKMVKLGELVHLLKLKLNDFPCHRFNVQHTSEVYDELVSNLDDHTIVKVHDFSENYTCLLPDEIQSLHWTQDTATVYPVVVLRKVNEDVREDHITFLTDDKKHDVPFVELCNSRLHEHYAGEGVSITHDVEYNDGCASQFKCIRAFAALARRNTKTTRLFCETSHGKSKSDGLGGVVKCYASRSVCSEKRVIRNAKELYEFFEERLVVINAFDSPKPMLNRLFHFISSEEIEEYRSSFPDETFKYIPGTLQIHQVVTTPGDKSHINYRNISCACMNCLGGEFAFCNRKNQFKDVSEIITLKKHVFSTAGKCKAADPDSSVTEINTDLNDDEINERETAEFMESEASKLIEEGDIALIKTGDDHHYYLLKLSKDPYETEGVVSDDYNHKFPPLHRVVEGHYLEMHKTNNDGDVYYLDEDRTAIVSAYCVVGNCPPPETMLQKRRGRQQEMFLITHNLHQALCETVNYSDI